MPLLSFAPSVVWDRGVTVSVASTALEENGLLTTTPTAKIAQLVGTRIRESSRSQGARPVLPGNTRHTRAVLTPHNVLLVVPGNIRMLQAQSIVRLVVLGRGPSSRLVRVLLVLTVLQDNTVNISQ
jgi:hypothetical protein